MKSFSPLRRLRPFAGAIVLSALSLPMAGNGLAASAQDPHDEALAADRDIQAAIGDLQASADLTDSSAVPYKQAAGRALDDLLNRNNPDYVAGAKKSGNGVGAIDRLQSLLQQADKQTWKAGVQSAWVNTMVAEGRLKDALAADGLDEFQTKSSSALEALLVAAGSEYRLGALGGLRGALATTDLGVPAKAARTDGCAAATAAPAYGVVDGYLTYITLPKDGSATRLPEAVGVRDVSEHDGFVVLHTAASGMQAKLCADHQSARAAAGPKVASAADPKAASVADPPPRLFTEAQAKAGEQVFTHICAACHGTNLQGKSAPAIAGAGFLNKAKVLGWSVDDLRELITTTMPRSNPGSLSPKQYADVISYLLAANCFEPGKQMFPQKTTPQLTKTKFDPANAVTRASGASRFCQQPDGQKQAMN